MSEAQAQIETFRRGERFRPPAPAVFLGSAAGQELAWLERALSTEEPQVREQIVRLLDDAGVRQDPLHAQGGQLIRNQQIISILVAARLPGEDLGRESALKALQLHVPAPLLKGYGKVLTADLKDRPSLTALLLIAKAKPAEAMPVIRKLLDTPRWSKERNAKIAAAALGNAGFEKGFVTPFLSTQDGAEKARLAEALGWIGTDGALRALAGEMRTPLENGVSNAFDRSVRLDLIAALSYNFPDLPILYESQIISDDDYAQVEAFCERRFGIRYTVPRPPFLAIRGYPFGG